MDPQPGGSISPGGRIFMIHRKCHTIFEHVYALGHEKCDVLIYGFDKRGNIFVVVIDQVVPESFHFLFLPYQ